jgi:hypothetical protein
VVLEAAAIPDAELGAFLRTKGLHEAQLVEWRKHVTDAASCSTPHAQKKVQALWGDEGDDTTPENDE